MVPPALRGQLVNSQTPKVILICPVAGQTQADIKARFPGGPGPLETFYV